MVLVEMSPVCFGNDEKKVSGVFGERVKNGSIGIVKRRHAGYNLYHQYICLPEGAKAIQKLLFLRLQRRL